MPNVPTDVEQHASDLAKFLALASLQLDASDWIQLRRQGFVAVESRVKGKVFKLRFRRNDVRQIVRSLGSDPRRAAAVAAELTELQTRRNLKRELAAIKKLVRDRFRQAKRSIEPIVLAYNWKFHGRTVRRPRPCKKHQ
jgi:hypothetical protein